MVKDLLGKRIERFQAVGRRKTSVARILLLSGEGRISINGRTIENYFPRPTHTPRNSANITIIKSPNKRGQPCPPCFP